jgi:hypothetical protein
MIKYIFVIGVFVTTAWALMSAGGYSLGGAGPLASFSKAADFVQNTAFAPNNGPREEYIGPSGAQLVKAGTGAPEATGTAYLPSTAATGPTINAEDSANWNKQYPEENKQGVPAGN